MNPVVRSILAVVIGVLVAFVLIACVEIIGLRVYPPPSGMDTTNLDAIRVAMARIPLGALLFVLLAYAAGSVAGGWVAARFAPNSKMAHAMTVAALLFGAGLMNLMTIPHPKWFWVTSSLIYWLGAWSGAQAAGAGPLDAGPGMNVVRRAGAVLVVAACVALAPTLAGAAIPDSAQLAGLRRAIDGAPGLRVVGAFGRERIASPILDSSGVRSAAWQPIASQRLAVFTDERSAPRAARAPIPWSEISALETGRPKTLQGAVGGTVVGLVVGAGIALAMNPHGAPTDEADAYRALGIVGGTMFGGTLVGTWIGSRSGFRPIYRAELGPEAHRSAYAAPRPPRRAARLAAGFGAKLAWDLADPPRHHARLPEPVGGFTAGAAFSSGAMITARREGSEAAIDALFDRWNTLYPPYALEGTNDH